MLALILGGEIGMNRNEVCCWGYDVEFNDYKSGCMHKFDELPDHRCPACGGVVIYIDGEEEK